MYFDIMGLDLIKSASEFLILIGIFHWYMGDNWTDSAISGVEGLVSNVLSDWVILPHVPDSLKELASGGADVVSAAVFATIRVSLHEYMFNFGSWIRNFMMLFIAQISGYYISGMVASTNPLSQLAFNNKKVKVISGGKTPAEQSHVVNKGPNKVPKLF